MRKISHKVLRIKTYPFTLNSLKMEIWNNNVLFSSTEIPMDNAYEQHFHNNFIGFKKPNPEDERPKLYER